MVSKISSFFIVFTKKKQKIETLKARQIIDSRGNPTIEVDLFLQDQIFGRVAVPSGASTGEFEALELRDGDKQFFGGKGVQKAIANINQKIAEEIIGKENLSQQEFDDLLINLDGSDNKANLGANAILGVSLAYYQACTKFFEKEPFYPLDGEKKFILPVPMFNILNGGAHANNNINIQEFMIIPLGLATFSKALQASCEVFQTLKNILARQGHTITVGDEGGFAPNLASNRQVLELIIEAVEKSHYKIGKDIFIGLDVAASELYQDGKYSLEPQGELLTVEQLISCYEGLIRDFPIISIEDGLDENDWEGWQILTQKLGDSCQLVGDDFFVTNPKRFHRAIANNCGNAILIKPNQIGSFSETLEAVRMAQEAGYGCIISHRSGETEDVFIADFSVATRAGQIKSGSTCRSERLAKYNQLLRIENNFPNHSFYAGKTAFSFLKNQF